MIEYIALGLMIVGLIMIIIELIKMHKFTKRGKDE